MHQIRVTICGLHPKAGRVGRSASGPYRTFVDCAANGRSESSVTDAAIRMNVQIGMGCLSLEAITFVCPTSIEIIEAGSCKSKKGRSAVSATTHSKREEPLFQSHPAVIDS